MTLRIVSGHHSTNIQGPDIYIDVRNYNKIKIDGNLLTVQAGVNQGMIYDFLKENKSEYSHVHGLRILCILIRCLFI